MGLRSLWSRQNLRFLGIELLLSQRAAIQQLLERSDFFIPISFDDCRRICDCVDTLENEFDAGKIAENVGRRGCGFRDCMHGLCLAGAKLGGRPIRRDARGL